jgi:hypothetical protein
MGRVGGAGWNRRRYSPAVRPVSRLKSRRNDAASSWPTAQLISSIGSPVCSSSRVARSTRRRWTTASGASPVAALKRRLRVRRQPGPLDHLLDGVRDREVTIDPALRRGDRRVAVAGRRVENLERRLAVAVPLQEPEAREPTAVAGPMWRAAR